MLGYKALTNNLTNRYGFTYEIGKKYYLEGDLKWRSNGFHFCTRVEDTLRYVDAYNDEVVIVLVEGEGKFVKFEDDYYGFYDMYASSELTIIREVKREEVFNIVINSNDVERVRRLVTLMKLNKDEIDIIRKKYPELNDTIYYYQNDEYILKRKLER